MAAALRAVKGVTSAIVAPTGTEATVLRKAGVGRDGDLTSAVHKAGYGASIIQTATLKLTVTGLECGDCEARADRALRAVAGARRVTVSKRTKTARVLYETEATTPARIQAALKKAGFANRAAS